MPGSTVQLGVVGVVQCSAVKYSGLTAQKGTKSGQHHSSREYVNWTNQSIVGPHAMTQGDAEERRGGQDRNRFRFL